MRKIRVVHVITRLILGGAQENTVLSCEGLHDDPDYEVTLITGPAIGPEGELFRYAESRGLRIRVIHEMRRAVHLWRDLITFLKLFRLFRRLRPHIVHTHSAKAGVLGRIAARWAGVPHIVHTIHGLPFHDYQGGLANGLARSIEWLAGLFTDRMVAVGEVMKEKGIRARLAREIDVIYSGMKVETFTGAPDQKAARKKLGLPPGAEILCIVSRLAPLKGHEQFLEAAVLLRKTRPDLFLLFVGDGTLRAELERRSESLATRFTGLVDPQRIPEHIAAADVVVHTSYREGLPRVVPQALLVGRPVVAFDCDGAREVVIEGVTGHLIPPGDATRLAKCLDELLSRPDRGRFLGEEGRRRYARQFRAETMVRDLDRLYRGRLRYP